MWAAIQLMKYEQRKLKPTKVLGHAGIITGLTSSGSRFFSTAWEEEFVRVSDTSSHTRPGSMRGNYMLQTGLPISALAASESRLFVVAMGNFISHGAINAWDISDEQGIPVIERVVQASGDQELERNVITADESRLFYASNAGIKAWNTNALDADPICFGGTLESPTLTVASDRLFASSSASGIQVWDITDLARPTCLHNLSCRDVRSLCAWEGYLFAGTGVCVAVWDLRSGRERYIDRCGGEAHAHYVLDVPIPASSGHAYEVFSDLRVLAGQLYATINLMGSADSVSKHEMVAWSLQGGSASGARPAQFQSGISLPVIGVALRSGSVSRSRASAIIRERHAIASLGINRRPSSRHCRCRNSTHRAAHCAALAPPTRGLDGGDEHRRDKEREVTWVGLGNWRASGVNNNLRWGPQGACPDTEATVWSSLPRQPLATLVDYGKRVILSADPEEKASVTHEGFSLYLAGSLPIGSVAADDVPSSPGRPARPVLVPPRQVPTPESSPLPLNAHLLHNVAHIELNAIDLAWDTLIRFSSLHGSLLESQFFTDFARIAADESRHLGWCMARLRELGFEYGDMPAHNMLWEGGQRSAGSVGERLVVVPLVQEARGLDAGHRLAERLVGCGDNRSAAIVTRIAEEEMAHVAVGVVWFRHLCRLQGVEPAHRFRDIVTRICPETLKGPFNAQARAEAGMDASWYSGGVPNKSEGAKDGSKGLPSAAAVMAPRRVEVELSQLRQKTARLASKKSRYDESLSSAPFLAQATPEKVARMQEKQLELESHLAVLSQRLEALLELEMGMANAQQDGCQ
eukprot:jgi/Mesvir1/27001/Mv20708-RA.1